MFSPDSEIINYVSGPSNLSPLTVSLFHANKPFQKLLRLTPEGISIATLHDTVTPHCLPNVWSLTQSLGLPGLTLALLGEMDTERSRYDGVLAPPPRCDAPGYGRIVQIHNGFSKTSPPLSCKNNISLSTPGTPETC